MEDWQLPSRPRAFMVCCPRESVLMSVRADGYSVARQRWHRGHARDPGDGAGAEHRTVCHDATGYRDPRVALDGVQPAQHAGHHRRPHGLVAARGSSERAGRRLQRLPHQARLAAMASTEAARVGLDGVPLFLQHVRTSIACLKAFSVDSTQGSHWATTEFSFKRARTSARSSLGRQRPSQMSQQRLSEGHGRCSWRHSTSGA